MVGKEKPMEGAREKEVNMCGAKRQKTASAKTKAYWTVAPRYALLMII